MTETADGTDFERLLEFVRTERNFDFTGYKRSSLERRIRKRMYEVDIADFAAYQDHLEVHPGEFEELFNTILINVTSFFRDPPAWEGLFIRSVEGLLLSKDNHWRSTPWRGSDPTPRSPFRMESRKRSSCYCRANPLGSLSFNPVHS